MDGAGQRCAPGAPIPSLVSFLFGLAEREELPGPAIIALLEDLGVGASAARSAIARMRTEGILEARRRGRVSDYRLAGPAASGFRRARDQAHPPGGESGSGWDGTFHGILFRAPEPQRRHRDRLRTAALLAGYVMLRPGLMIAVEDQWGTLSEVVSEMPQTVDVSPLTLRMRPEDARRAAAEAWDLAGLDGHLRELAETIRHGLAESDPDPGAPAPWAPASAPASAISAPASAASASTSAAPGEGAEALRTMVALTLPVYRALIVVPTLPPELLPPDWSLPELLALVGQAHARYAAPAQEHLNRALAAGR